MKEISRPCDYCLVRDYCKYKSNKFDIVKTCMVRKGVKR